MASFFESSITTASSSRSPGKSLAGTRVRRFARSGFAESTLQEMAWHRTRSAGLRWAVAGAIVGSLAGLVAFAPAAWLARVVSSLTDNRVMLADARGTIWRGDAVAVLTGGQDSRSATSLPGRLSWSMRPAWMAMNIDAQHECCLNGVTRLRLEPGLGRMALTLLPTQGAATHGQWPAAWLAGLGTPWNTLQMGGLLSLSSPGFTMERVQGRVRFRGDAQFELAGASSRVATVPTLGSYRLQIKGDPTSGSATVNLLTTQGPLMLSGQGQWLATGLRFRGEARSAEGSEEALSNLLNIIGRRQGAVSVISLG